MEENKNILGALNKRQKPDVPEGFFDNFSDTLMPNLDNKNTKFDTLSKSNKSAVPDNFFDNFSSKLMKKIESEEKKPIKVVTLRMIGYLSAVAASLLIIFTLIPNDKNSVADNIEIEDLEVLDEISDDEYLAFIDEYEMIDFIVENEDIEIDEESTEDDEDIFYYLEGDIEEMYLDL